MKRIIISIPGGIFLPVILTALAITTVWLLPQYNLVDLYINGENAPGLIFAPVVIPVYIDQIFGIIVYGHSDSSRFLLKTICFIGFDFVLYALLTYSVISYFGWFNPKRKLKYSAEPPPPPIEF